MTLNLSPTPDNLLIGAGELYLDTHIAGAKTGFQHVGNVELFEQTVEDTKLQKYSSMRSDRPLYAERLQRRLLSYRVQFDEFSWQNCRLLMMGDAVDYTHPVTGVTGEVLFANVPAATLGAALGGKTFRVAKSIAGISAVTVEVGASALVLNTDYTVDLAKGTITILAASSVVTNAADDLTIDYTPVAVTTGQAKQIRLGTQSFIEVSGLFIPDPTNGPNMMVEFWRASVAPEGALGFISQEWATASVILNLQDDSAGAFGGSSASPLGTVTIF